MACNTQQKNLSPESFSPALNGRTKNLLILVYVGSIV